MRCIPLFFFFCFFSVHNIQSLLPRDKISLCFILYFLFSRFLWWFIGVFFFFFFFFVSNEIKLFFVEFSFLFFFCRFVVDATDDPFCKKQRILFKNIPRNRYLFSFSLYSFFLNREYFFTWINFRKFSAEKLFLFFL